jgi:hypothetical protein
MIRKNSRADTEKRFTTKNTKCTKKSFRREAPALLFVTFVFFVVNFLRACES